MSHWTEAIGYKPGDRVLYQPPPKRWQRWLHIKPRKIEMTATRSTEYGAADLWWGSGDPKPTGLYQFEQTKQEPHTLADHQRAWYEWATETPWVKHVVVAPRTYSSYNLMIHEIAAEARLQRLTSRWPWYYTPIGWAFAAWATYRVWRDR